MSNVLLKASDKIEEAVYEHGFNFETADGTILNVVARHTLTSAQHMIRLGENITDVERYKIYVDSARSLFTCTDDGINVDEFMSDATLVQMFIVYFEHFAEDISRVINETHGVGNTPSKRSPKGLQSKSPNQANRQRRY